MAILMNPADGDHEPSDPYADDEPGLTARDVFEAGGDYLQAAEAMLARRTEANTMISAMRDLCNPHQPPDVQRAQRVLVEAMHEASAELQILGRLLDPTFSPEDAANLTWLVLAEVFAVLYRDGADIPAGRLVYAFLDLARLEGHLDEREGRA